jgi:hypothetical protein
MPGEAGKQLFEKYPLSDQSVVARAHGRNGGKAGKGKPKKGGSAKGVPNKGRKAKGVPNTGRAAKGVKRAPKTGRAAKGSKKTGKAAKGVPATGRAAKGAAHWRAGGDGVMQTPQELLLALQQDISSSSC